MKVIIPEYNNYLEKDYKYGALNILWYRDDAKRFLVFASIELYPNEHPKPINIKEEYHRVGNKGKKYFYFTREVMLAKKLIEIYSDIVQSSKPLTTFWQKKEETFESSPFLSEPQYPVMSIVSSPPYLPDFSGCVRTNFLFNKYFKKELKDICLDKTNLDWINQKLNFDINENQEFFGAIVLSAYNPLIRKVHFRGGGENTEKVYLDIEARKNVDLSKLKLFFIEKRPKGFSSFIEHSLKETSLEIDLKEEIDEIGFAIICPKRGLIYWHDFCGFLKKICMRMNVASEKLTVNVKNKDYSKDEENYTVQRYSKLPEMIVGNDTKNDILDFLNEIEIKKNREKNSKNHNQVTFCENKTKATEFVRKLIGKAREQVIIIDPYFTTRELFKYPLAITTNLKIKILTSKVGLNSKNKQIAKKTNIDENQLFENQLKSLTDRFNIEAYIMTGDPIFHDRYFIIDNEVWLSGNSLADLGDRISTIVKLPNPTEIIEIYESIIEEKKKVKKWEIKGSCNATTK